MAKPRGDSEIQELELAGEWPVDLPDCYLEGLMVEADAQNVLVALNQPSDYEDRCFVFDLENGCCQSEKWFQPDWIKQYWKTWHMGPEKGVRDLSVAGYETRTIAAVATKANYAACWELGSETGCTIGDSHGIQTVAVHPNTDLLAIGTGKKVLDSVTPAIAEVQLWSTDGKEMLDKRRLPGSCVINMLWVHHEHGLVPGYSLHAVDGRPIGMGPQCVVMESCFLKIVLVVTTETRNQRGGFVTLLDPQLLTILDIAEIPEATGLSSIAAWPERREIWAGSFRRLDDLHNTYKPTLDVKAAPRKTASKLLSKLWLSDGRVFKFSRGRSGAWVAQLWKPTE